jgi:hypothetical protein
VRSSKGARACTVRLTVRKYEAGEFTDELAEAVRIADYERKIAELERKAGSAHHEGGLAQKRGATGTRRKKTRITPS